MSQVPEIRIRALNDVPERSDGDFVLYWTIANRRTRWNFSLQRAVEWATQLDKPLVVLEALRCGYKWASDRLHRFVLQGMADNRERLKDKPALYYPYVEPEPEADKGLLAALAGHACAIVTDDFPCFFLPRMLASAADSLPVLLEAVDSNGLLPLRGAPKVFTKAHSFRRFLQKELCGYLDDLPLHDPLARIELPALDALPEAITKRWPPAAAGLLAAEPEALAELPIDHEVGPAAFEGGAEAARRTLETFLDERFPQYADGRNHPDEDASSGLSPYLHFGHISAHEIFHRITQLEDWSTGDLADKTTGSREGWWNMSPAAESFLDELITWRELGYNMCHHRDDYDQYDSLPDWAQETLADHAADDRPHVYTLEEFETADTHDRIWNAAQTQLVGEGRLHNYLRMLWGKKIFEWSATPQDALDVMIHLNNKYAVDGRDPNSYSGIFWVLGRYDRAWGPERPIYGKIRYMTSESTQRKLKMKKYLARFAANDED